MHEKLRSGRLTLCELTSADAAFIFELVNDEAWLRHIGDRGVRTLADAVRYIEDGPAASYRAHSFGLWRVSVRDSGEPIGLCGLLRRPGLEHPDLGYALLPQYRSLGYAREACASVLDFASTELDSPYVDAIVSRQNKRSIRLLRELGFEAVGPVTLPASDAPVELYRKAI